MTTTKCFDPQTDPKIDDFVRRLNKLDFGPLAYKLMHPEGRPGFSFAKAIDAIRKYKGFLFLHFVNPGKAICPSMYIDHVWHTHVEDTELYFVQSGMLFGHYLHHFPFFGKRNEADKRDLLEAGKFTRNQAFDYFGWDEGDWCGTGRKPHLPRPSADLVELCNVLFPRGVNTPAMVQNADAITIQTGNYRHTVEHLSLQKDTFYSDHFWELIDIILVINGPQSCMPPDINILNEISVIQQTERLEEISRALVENRLTPEGYSADLVNLQVSH